MLRLKSKKSQRKLAKLIDNNFLFPVFPAWIGDLKDVWRTAETFEPTHKKAKGSFPGAIYTEKTPEGIPKRWLGKLGSPPGDEILGSESLRNAQFVRGVNRDALKEKIAFDFYHVLSKCLNDVFYVPPSVLCVLKILNQFTEGNIWAKAVFDHLNQNETKKVHASGNFFFLFLISVCFWFFFFSFSFSVSFCSIFCYSFLVLV